MNILIVNWELELSFEEMVKHRQRKGLTDSNRIDLETDEIAEQQKMTKAGTDLSAFPFQRHYLLLQNSISSQIVFFSFSIKLNSFILLFWFPPSSGPIVDICLKRIFLLFQTWMINKFLKACTFLDNYLGTF